jgi:hypothetical protein
MSLGASLRRSFRRYVRLPCEVVREHDFRLIGDLALDLSTRGMLVRAKQPVLTGEEVVVAFQGPRSNVWFDAIGTVARVLHGRRPGDGGVCLGIEFHDVAPELEHLLFAQLQGRSGPEPMRARRILAA